LRVIPPTALINSTHFIFPAQCATVAPFASGNGLANVMEAVRWWIDSTGPKTPELLGVTLRWSSALYEEKSTVDLRQILNRCPLLPQQCLRLDETSVSPGGDQAAGQFVEPEDECVAHSYQPNPAPR
jgi:hypothetical protein